MGFIEFSLFNQDKPLRYGSHLQDGVGKKADYYKHMWKISIKQKVKDLFIFLIRNLLSPEMLSEKESIRYNYYLLILVAIVLPTYIAHFFPGYLNDEQNKGNVSSLRARQAWLSPFCPGTFHRSLWNGPQGPSNCVRRGKRSGTEPRGTGRAGVESPAIERAAETRLYLGNADTLGQKPRRTQCTVEISGELK